MRLSTPSRTRLHRRAPPPKSKRTWAACSHMDTSPDCSGKDVKPQLVRNYRGGDIVLPGDPTQVIRVADHPALKDQIGNDMAPSDGTTLLGADNQARPGAIM